MKLLLTSSGISNPSIDDALVGLLGKPIAESSALIIPTAIYPFPDGAAGAWRAVCGKAPSPLCEVGWKSLGILELTALPSIKEESWVPMVRETDALLVWGGDVLYLCYWMRQSGLANLLPSLSESVYVGVSAGSIVMTPYNCDAEFNLQYVPAGSDQTREGDRALGLVDFALRVHLDREGFEDSSMANVEKWASEIPVPTYAIDDQTAIKVADGVRSKSSPRGTGNCLPPARKQATRFETRALRCASVLSPERTFRPERDEHFDPLSQREGVAFLAPQEAPSPANPKAHRIDPVRPFGDRAASSSATD
jgi:dipeptidase E